MKKTNLLLPVLAMVFAAFSIASCKGKDKKDTTTTDTNTVVDTPVVITPAPVVIANDEALTKGVMDATKDYPKVKAMVADSIISLSGEIKRSDWQKLNPTLNSLHPKRVNSTNLIIK
ncbi:MAG: hypothetical protein ABIN94_22515 [Ferruginibacter sp.]